MDIIPNLRWDCIEFTGKSAYRTILVDDEMFTSRNLGDELCKESLSGVYVASSKFGITIFDLFSEVLQEKDLKRFLTDNQARILTQQLSGF